MCDGVNIVFPVQRSRPPFYVRFFLTQLGQLTPYTSTQLTDHAPKTQERPLCLDKTCRF